ncbi:LOW QUALITY PROTEIN: hypothetical protein KUTeg_018561 [Tegillarca granosa]|uniref:Ammonium transporter AmtB-like domain-containing protein n=1 Tax=Tegillarca granosa TaxID=220873 RepID=A0ABQ9EP04_TEGGR|nr:LOW QUALITY PROTEIN: hypothetical protein KUTeg_018561 [Tegillarca granosa]
MHTGEGFGLLESGSASVKNEANIMVKNVVDVIFGGLTYWMVGYGLSFGDAQPYSNPFCGWGSFFVTASEDDLGWVYAQFFFQASFATTATTIVSGSMAERTKLEAYIIFSMLNTFIFAIPAHWMWAANGWLRTLGVVDIAGAGPVHLVGGLSGLIATIMLKPRYERFKTNDIPPMGSPTNAILGMWGFLGFACGSTFGISGLKWKLAARSAVAAVCTSISGGIIGLTLSYIVNNRKFDIPYMINGILGSLVAITSICVLVQPKLLFIGGIGALISEGAVALLNKLQIDDPVGCVGIHACSGIWSLLAAGMFVKKDILAGAIQLETVGDGLFQNGGFKQLGIQCLAIVAIGVWTVITGGLFLKLIDLTVGLRVPLGEEILGADIVEHSVSGIIYDKKTKQIIHLSDSDDNILNHADKKIFHLLKDQIQHRKRSHSLGFHIEDDRSRQITLFKNMKNDEKMRKGRKGNKDMCFSCLRKLPCICCSGSNKGKRNVDNKTMTIINDNLTNQLQGTHDAKGRITTVSERISQSSYLTTPLISEIIKYFCAVLFCFNFILLSRVCVCVCVCVCVRATTN